MHEQKTNLGRPQALASLSLGLGYQLPAANAPRVFLAYQFYLQFPFVKEYQLFFKTRDKTSLEL